jgi:PAS domain S-box-containing protein
MKLIDFPGLLDMCLDPAVTISLSGIITDANFAFEAVTGVQRSQLCGSAFSSYFTEPLQAESIYTVRDNIELLPVFPMLLRLVNGDLTPILFRSSTFYSSQGTLQGIFAVARGFVSDKWVNGLQLAQENIMLSRAELGEFMAESVEADVVRHEYNRHLRTNLSEVAMYMDALDKTSIIALTDQRGIIIKVNFNFCEISKFPYNELIGQDHRIVNSGYHSKGFMRCLWKTIVSGKVWKGELRNMAKDGSYYWVDTTIVPFLDEDGKPYQFLAVRVDISQRKEAERQLLVANKTLNKEYKLKEKQSAILSTANYARSLIEASRDPLFTISVEGRITDVNHATQEVTGKSRENLIGSNFSDYFSEPTKAEQGYQKVFEENFVADYPLTIVDGVNTDVLFNGSVYNDEKGEVVGAVLVARDSTEQKRFEQELIEAKTFAERATKLAEDAQLKAEDAARSKQQFLSNMSHEIRTPLNAIIGFTNVMLKTDLTLKQKDFLEAIRLSGNTLVVLIDDILDLAKVDSGKMEFEKIPFNLGSSISEILHLFDMKIQEKNLIFIKEFDRRIPEVLLGDPARLHQIFLNLMSNAVKFTSSGSISFIVELKMESEEHVDVEFFVSDTGIGIGANQLEGIFENFQQAASSTSRLYGGTGLGLAIVKKLVESQAGTIRVSSTEGEGTTFSFILSFEKTSHTVALDTDFLEPEDEVLKVKVLVVEDIPLNQLLMKTILDDYGFEGDIASNGKIAIEKFKLNCYDVVLMDLQMPEMNGFEATAYIRHTLNSNVPIIALTADVTTADLEKCREVGMNDYVSKPIDERVLYGKIVSLVSKSNMLSITAAYEDSIAPDACIDLSYLRKQTKSNPELMMEMIALYLEQTPPLLRAIKKSVEDQDFDTLNAAIHKMIPSFRIVGLDERYERLSLQVRDIARNDDPPAVVKKMVSDLEHICNKACRELKEAYNRIKELNEK